MKRILSLLSCFCIGLSLFSQTNWEKTPIHIIKNLHICACCKYETNASIDSSLWEHFLNQSLFPDRTAHNTLPQGIYRIRTQFIVDTTGKVVQAKAFENPYGLGNLVEQRLNNFRYKWSPATQNGRPVKSYHKVILVFDIKSKDK